MTNWTRSLRLQHLDVLVSLAETQNLSLSAEQMNMTQPGLSKWLKKLEAELGLALFERHARGLRPTVEGGTLIEHATRIRADLARAREDMSALVEGRGGRVAIGASGAAIASIVPDAVTRLLERAPKLEIRIVEAPMDRLLHQLGLGEIDFAVGRFVSSFDDRYITPEILYREQMEIAVRQATITWSDLTRYRWIAWSHDIPARHIVDSSIATAGHAPIRPAIISNSVLGSIALVARTDMIMALSSRALDLPEKTGMLKRLCVPLDAKGDIAIYSRKGDHSSVAQRLVIDAFRTASGTA